MPPPSKKKARVIGKTSTDAPENHEEHSRSDTESFATCNNLVGTMSLELIGHIARFVGTSSRRGKDNDLQNICVAVGRANTSTIRHVVLHKNYEYLNQSLVRFVRDYPNFIEYTKDPSSCHDVESGSLRLKCRSNVINWMAVNSWQELVTRERVEAECRDGIVHQHTHVNMGPIHIIDQGVNAIKEWALDDPLIYYAAFNNIALATTLGLVDVIKYLIEDMLVEKNGQYTFRCKGLPCLPKCGLWSADAMKERRHLLTIAMHSLNIFIDPVAESVLQSLLLYNDLDVNATDPYGKGRHFRHVTNESVFYMSLHFSVPLRYFKSFIKHPTFDPREEMNNTAGVGPHRDILIKILGHLETYFIGRNHVVRQDEVNNILQKLEAILRASSDKDTKWSVSSSGSSISNGLEFVKRRLNGISQENYEALQRALSILQVYDLLDRRARSK